MNKSVALLLILVLATLNIITFLPVKAESRTMVVPDDYPTVASAIGNATQGDTIYVKKGTYEEHLLMINKAITLIGEDRNNTIIKNVDAYDENITSFFPWAIPPLVAVEIRANNIKILNFTITSNNRFLPINVSADGVFIVDNIFEPKSEGISVKGNNNTIARNILSGLGNIGITCNGSYNNIANNTLSGLDNGCIECSGSYNIITGNTIIGCSGLGISVVASYSIVYNNTFDFVEEYATIHIGGCGNTVVKNNLTSNGAIVSDGLGNTANGNIVGILDTSGSNHTFTANEVFYGVAMGSTEDDASNITFYHNNFNFLPVSVRPVGEKIFEVWSGVRGPIFFDNGKEGNYWSDYNGADANGDGIGDTPYVIHANDTKNYEFTADFDISNIIMTDHYPLMSPFDIESVTIELPEWANVSDTELPNFDLAETEPFPAALALVTTGTVVTAIAGAGVIVYFKKRKR